MMSEEETILRAQQLIREGRIIEAGFVSTMLPNAPDDAGEHALRMVRLAYFYGAKNMMQVLSAVSQEREATIETLMDQVQRELTTFFRKIKKAPAKPQEKHDIH
jgi:hypothetical protein